MEMASFSFPPLGKEKIQWKARPAGTCHNTLYFILIIFFVNLASCNQKKDCLYGTAS
jgi:hypothetical protein